MRLIIFFSAQFSYLHNNISFIEIKPNEEHLNNVNNQLDATVTIY